MSLFAGERWFNIPAHRPFLTDLAQGLTEALAGEGPEGLADALVLTPSRRAARDLAEAFLSVSGGRAALLPQIRPLGDLDEGEPPFEPGDLALDLPPAISPWRRRFELSRLVAAERDLLGRDLDASGALELADALADLLDRLAIAEKARPQALEDLVAGDLAQHWRVSARFLEVALRRWPARLAELQLMDVAERRVRLLHVLADRWETTPPPGVLVAAGSTGGALATERLLGVIGRAPRGLVVLPGLDQDLADSAWEGVDAQHPQDELKRLLDTVGVARGAVRPWPVGRETARDRWRRRIVNEALRPAEATKDWRKVIDALRAEGAADGTDPVAAGLAGLTVVAGRTEEDSAGAIAVLMRESLEAPGGTCALITPDLALARRVSARLARWGVEADSSAGVPLAQFPVGVLAGIVADLAADVDEPIGMLAALKHPLTRLGLDRDAFEPAATVLERRGLRGARPRDRRALEGRLEEKGAAESLDLAIRLQAALDRVAAPFIAGEAELAAAARGLAEAMEALAADDMGSPGSLWAGPAGECAAGLIAALIGESEGSPPVSARGFGGLVRRLLAEETVRSAGALHPRLRILGVLEGRMIRADRMILAGLEEGTWPRAAAADPFLSRGMMGALELPPPERRIGQAAHDFAQAACAPQVYLVHSERRDGAPAVKSRWLWRLETLVKGANGPGAALPSRGEIGDWAAALDAPGRYAPAGRPAPKPPVEHRPHTLSVTRIEALTRDPYAVWARNMLALNPLDPPAAHLEASTRGSAIHKAFERFAERAEQDWPAAPDAVFEDLYLTELVKAGLSDAAMTRERALAKEAAKWVAEWERGRRADGRRIVVEQNARLTFDIAGEPFTLTARADRIELDSEGYAHVLDYKTGAPPTKKQVETGFAPQLTLTAALVARGAFAGVEHRHPGDLTYVRVTGRTPPGAEITPVGADKSSVLAEMAFEGLARLILRYRDPDMPYASRTAPQFVKDRPGDYDHLARVFEWTTSGEEDGE